jgi:cytochrome c oxidase assembly protein subunit 15
VDNPRVSHYRLTAHLGLAVLIYAWMWWLALDRLLPPTRAPASAGVRRYSSLLVCAIYLMILSGGLVAGMRAGHAYNTFPLMDGHWIPPNLFALEPWYKNIFTNMVTVQFDHRLIAWLLSFAVPVFWFYTRRHALTPRARLATNVLLATLALQITLGIATLLLVVPLGLAVAHQGGALLVLSAALWVRHELSTRS